MPQLAQLSEVALSQFLWLAIGLGFIFFVIGRGMVPKIQATLDDREKRVAADLEAAQQARLAADATEAAWRERMDAARAEAAKLTGEAKQASARDTEAKVKKAADKISLKAAASEQKLREALNASRAEIENVAAEATQDLVSRLVGIKVDKPAAAAAVKAELNG
jgi:F-type H+-transporting ATPase subunit b